MLYSVLTHFSLFCLLGKFLILPLSYLCFIFYDFLFKVALPTEFFHFISIIRKSKTLYTYFLKSIDGFLSFSSEFLIFLFSCISYYRLSPCYSAQFLSVPGAFYDGLLLLTSGFLFFVFCFSPSFSVWQKNDKN